MPVKLSFNINCRKCKRLTKYLKQVKKAHPEYHCKPVDAFGDENAQLLVVGLAPGLHGANATGRPFTGDSSGAMLFQTLHKFGFSTLEQSASTEDGMQLSNCKITNAVKCLPPDNKPIGDEVNTCNKYLSVELSRLPDNAVIVVLGSVAHKAVIKAFDLPQKDYKFAHGAEYHLQTATGHCTIISSYHCSRYNTQTKRLTDKMFQQVFARAQKLINHV